MKVQGKHYHTIWLKPGNDAVVQVIDQRWLPHQFVVEDLSCYEDATVAIRDMHVRGAPLIGVCAAFGMYLACLEYASMEDFSEQMRHAAEGLKASRPTAVNLAWAADRVLGAVLQEGESAMRVERARAAALRIKDEELERSRSIGEHGVKLLEQLAQRKNGQTVNVLTHCNAGWLAAVDFGTATAPIYEAHAKGIPVHVWVDETRPRNQGARLTAWELGEHGVPHTVIADNTGGHLMQRGMVDVVIVGTDRTTSHGHVVNKIGTYLKALAAKHNNIPFYVALPSSSVDWSLGPAEEVPIEERGSEEVNYIQGLLGESVEKVLLTPPESPAANYAFDVTPAKFVSGFITERGICVGGSKGIRALFPEV